MKVEIDWERFRRDVVHERGVSPRVSVARLVGCSESNLKNLEEGKYKPTTELFLSLCRWMGREWTRYDAGFVVNSPAVPVES